MIDRPGRTGAVASRFTVHGLGPEAGLREAIREWARRSGVVGWVRVDDGGLLVHAEGEPGAVEGLRAFVAGATAEPVEERAVKAEGHEQFAVRGMPAGVFVVQEHAATSRHFDLRLEVDGKMRSWAVPKGPSMDPGVRRLAVEVDEHDKGHNTFEARTGSGGVLVWDRGHYEQGGRIPWPEALERGHAVFVLHGEKLRGGFVLQRTRGAGLRAQWLLLKRRDDQAQPGSDVVAAHPQSVVSGATLDELLDDGYGMAIRGNELEAITGAARTVFGREGYKRTSIEAIATEARVSTRTIYNHFEGKQHLFSAVLYASAAHVADGFVADLERGLTGADARGELVALGYACARLRTGSPEHFAMVEQIRAEAAHLPREAIEPALEAGPLRVLDELMRRLEELAEQGLLRIGNSRQAAVHFSALVTAGSTTYYGAPAIDDAATGDSVLAGVDAFLHGYAVPAPGSGAPPDAKEVPHA